MSIWSLGTFEFISLRQRIPKAPGLFIETWKLGICEVYRAHHLNLAGTGYLATVER